MKTLIVYESMFGNTEQIAHHVADGLQEVGGETALVDVRDARAEDVLGADLLVIGAPTHAFSLTRQSTRDDAVRQGADPARATLGVREWLDNLRATFPSGSERPKVAVFDTRVERVRRLPGSAAKRAARVVRADGFVLIDRPRSFYVADVKGPVAAGELDQASEWGTRLFGLAETSHDRDASGGSSG